MNFDFKKQSDDLLSFRNRLLIAFLLFLLAFIILIMRFAWLQIINQDAYLQRAEKNRTITYTTQGARGTIIDRNGIDLAINRMGYSLEITPDQTKNLTQTIDDLSQIIPITPQDRRRFKRLREDLNRYDSIPIRLNLTDQEIAVFIAQANRFPGVQINQHEYRIYPQGSLGSHFLGYIGAISQSDKNRLERENSLQHYEGARKIGKVGLERSYEDVLHAQPGYETLEITASGRSVRRLESQPPSPGKTLKLTIDSHLQQIAEKAMGSHAGAIVAIDPRTGGVLTFASLPTYDPNLFPEGIDPENWNALNTSQEKPLFNRVVRGTYPIGSTYKPFMALAGLAKGVTTPEYTLDDQGVFFVGKHRFRDMTGIPKGPVNLRRSIEISSDVYYYWLSVQLGVDNIHDFMSLWGFGQRTGIDLIGEQTGILPSRQWKEQRFQEPWYIGDTPSIGIGQGYNSFTILQLASATATLASRGVVMPPHLVQEIIDPRTNHIQQVRPPPVRHIHLPKKDWDVVIQGMIDVTEKGTARHTFRNTPYKVAGKTGTAQVITVAQDSKYDKDKLKREYHDHALFIAFAPADKPTIAVAALVENAGFGAQTAAPIVKKLLDYWITGKNDLNLPAPQHLQKVQNDRR